MNTIEQGVGILAGLMHWSALAAVVTECITFGLLLMVFYSMRRALRLQSVINRLVYGRIGQLESFLVNNTKCPTVTAFDNPERLTREEVAHILFCTSCASVVAVKRQQLEDEQERREG